MNLKEYSEYLLAQISSLGVCNKEVEYRRNELNQALKTFVNEFPSPRYYNLIHELKSILFLSDFGTVEPAMDHAHTAGCDAKLNNHYQIECVCTSPGSISDENEYDRLSFLKMEDSTVFDYKEKERFLFSRITSVLQAKCKFCDDHLAKNTIAADKPFLIFLGLGELAYEMFCGDYGKALTGVLLGKGDPVVRINSDDSFTLVGYTHNESFLKHNGAAIDCNLFCRDQFRNVSGIIFTKSTIFEAYSLDNTWLFPNPFAKTQIRTEDFPEMVYWSTEGNTYLPKRNGKRI